MREQTTSELARTDKNMSGAIFGRCVRLMAIAATFAAVSGAANAVPLALLDRNGSYVAIEAYAPHIVRVTLSLDKDLALAPPGYGFSAAPDSKGWRRTNL